MTMTNNSISISLAFCTDSMCIFIVNNWMFECNGWNGKWIHFEMRKVDEGGKHREIDGEKETERDK